MEGDARGFRVAVCADALVNPEPGGLDALATETGWDPATKTAYVPTFFGNSVLHWCPLTSDVSAIRCSPPFMRPTRPPRSTASASCRPFSVWRGRRQAKPPFSGPR